MKIQLGDITVTIRKWKGKDKKEFLNILKSNPSSPIQLMEPLVYPCIEENVVLSLEQFRYVLTRIRVYSLGDEIEFDFFCQECEKSHKETLKITDVIRGSGKKITNIKLDDIEIKIGNIKNKEIYNKMVEEDELFDLLLRIEKINGDDAFTLQSLIDFFDDLDIDVLENIIKEWDKIRFKVDDTNEIECPHCKTKTTYSFDEIPGFIPDTWRV